MAGKESPRISLLMATGRNYRLLGVKVNISMIVPPSGRAVLAIAIYIVIFSPAGARSLIVYPPTPAVAYT